MQNQNEPREAQTEADSMTDTGFDVQERIRREQQSMLDDYWGDSDVKLRPKF